MLVSIVTPSYNQARFIEDTIRSVLSQDYSEIEYLVVDGGSTDGTVEILHRYKNRLSGWVSESDRGQTDAINKGFGRAAGDILAWINSDDTYEPGAVSAALKYLQDHPHVGLVYGDCNFIDEYGEVVGRFRSRQTSRRMIRQGYSHIPQQTMFFRADLWKQVGPLDPSFHFAMDYDLWTRISARAEMKYVPQTWANFRLHAAGKTIQADERFWPEMLKIHYRDGGSFLSVLVARYYLRQVFAPVVNWRRRRMIDLGSHTRNSTGTA